MSIDPSSVERDCLRVRAAALDASLLARLEACTQNTWTHLNPAEILFEQRLQAIAPASMPIALMTAVASSCIANPCSDDETIVRFPAHSGQHPTWWSAAAAVALIGAVTALLVPLHQTHPQVAKSPSVTPNIQAPPSTGKFIPAGFKRGLSETKDEGVIWQSNDQPHRVLKVVYQDRVTLKDKAGRTYQVEQPRVEYILLPAKTD